jgi:hypothetical protein
MKQTSNVLVAALAIALGVGGWYWWGLYQNLVADRTAVANLEDVGQLRKQLWQIQLQIKNLSERLARANGQGGPAGTAAGQADDGKADPAAAGQNGMALFAQLMRNPEFRRLQALQLSGWFDQNFAGLMRQLNLPPDQLAKFKALAMERMQVAQDAFSAAIDQGLDPQKDMKSIQQIVKQQTDEVDTQIKGVVGDAGWNASMNYTRQMQQRLEASQLQTSLSYTPNPMTDAQVQQLSQAITSNPVKRDPDAVVAVTGYALQQPALLNGQQAGVQGPMGGVQPVPAISDDAINAAAGFLSQPQVAALKQMQQMQQSQQQLGQILKSQQQTAKSK